MHVCNLWCVLSVCYVGLWEFIVRMAWRKKLLLRRSVLAMTLRRHLPEGSFTNKMEGVSLNGRGSLLQVRPR